MIKKRGHHPDEIVLPLGETERRKQWRAQDSRQKEYERGQIIEEIQQELSLNMSVRGNADLPLPPEDIEDTSEKQKTLQSPPETDKQDPNRIYGSVRHSLYSHFSKTLAAQYRKDAQKLAEEHWLNANGHPETTSINDPSKRLRRRLDQKLHPELYQERPQLPKYYQEHARQHYPFINEPFSSLLYLHDNLSLDFSDIAFRLNSSPRQAEIYYDIACFQHIQHFVTTARCPPHLIFKKNKHE